ncbi:MAG: hypothetical protein JWR10_2862 [Rubritepida sp.]|nr:hypothetical protein [Rubritepida sp.]
MLLRDAMGRAQARQAKNVAYTPLPAPIGYTEAWEVTTLGPPIMPGFNLDRRIFIRSNAEGIPLEFTQCQTPEADPKCGTTTTAEGEAAMQISFTYTVRRWDEHEAIRAAVQRLVRSWM